MKLITKLGCTALVAAGLVGCQNMGGPLTQQQTGTVVGGVAGGILGASAFHGDSKVVGAVGGAIIGSLIGGAIGQSMDQQDRVNAEQAMINTPVGQEATWTNSRTHAHYTIRPVRQYHSRGTLCRRARIYTFYNGERHVTYTTICRRNGHWETI